MTPDVLGTESAEFHPLYGPSAAALGWAPAPSYLLRRARVLRQVAAWSTGRLLEIGCGGGALLRELSAKGLSCEGLETSEPARKLALRINSDCIPVHATPQSHWGESFDFIIALEVLEHIEDDFGALRQWREWLKPGGGLLLSVPAHMSKWTVSDVWAGHYRRYEKDELTHLLIRSGFAVESIESWGFPLANLLLPVRARVHAREQDERGAGGLDRGHNNAMSGIAREKVSKLYPLLKSPLGVLVMRTAFFLQAASAGRDWGTGYLLFARKIP